MSNYETKVRRKDTGEIINIMCLDDYFGKHNYGYQVPNKTVYREEEFWGLYEEIEED